MRFFAVPLLFSLGLAITFADPSEGASIPGARVVASTTPLATRVRSPCPPPLVWDSWRGRCGPLHAIGRRERPMPMSKFKNNYPLVSRTCYVPHCFEFGPRSGNAGGDRICLRWGKRPVSVPVGQPCPMDQY
jgi:hypothetical protein